MYNKVRNIGFMHFEIYIMKLRINIQVYILMKHQ